jgi:hypothetical protein
MGGLLVYIEQIMAIRAGTAATSTGLNAEPIVKKFYAKVKVQISDIKREYP